MEQKRLKIRLVVSVFLVVLVFANLILPTFERDVHAGGPEVLTWKNRSAFEWAGAEGNPTETFRAVDPPLSNGFGGTIDWDPADKTVFETRVETSLTDDEDNAGTFCTYVNVVILLDTSAYNSTWNSGGGATPIDEVQVNEWSSTGCTMNDRLGVALEGLSESTIEPALPTGPGDGGGDSIAAEWVDRAHIKITRGNEDRIFKDGNIYDDRQIFENDKDDCESRIHLYKEDGSLGDTRSPRNSGELVWNNFSPNNNRCSDNAAIGGIGVAKGNGQTARRIIWFQRVSETEIKAVDGKDDHTYEKVEGSNTKYNNTSQGECPDQVLTNNPPQTRRIGATPYELVGHDPRGTSGDGCETEGNPRIPLGNALMYPIGEAPPGASDGTNNGGGGEEECDAGEGLTWIICPTVRLLSNAINDTAGLINTMLEFPPDLLSTSGATYEAWKGLRNLANIGLVLVFVIIIYSQATGGKQ